MIEILSRIADLSFVASFFAPIIGGELAVILLGFLSAQGGFGLWIVIFFSLLGMISLDSFWFWASRSRWAGKMTDKMRQSPSYTSLENKIESFSHKSDIAILLISKILVGTRILVLIYLGMRKISYIKFIGYNSVATFIWAIILGYFGWFAGRGYYNLSETYNRVSEMLVSLLLMIIVFYALIYIVRLWISRK